jgi:hypothetical protein
MAESGWISGIYGDLTGRPDPVRLPEDSAPVPASNANLEKKEGTAASRGT